MQSKHYVGKVHVSFIPHISCVPENELLGYGNQHHCVAAFEFPEKLE